MNISSKGQITIPETIRESLGWQTGQELVVILVEGGIFLKARNPFPPSQLEEVAGCLAVAGVRATIEEMDEAVGKGLAETQTLQS